MSQVNPETVPVTEVTSIAKEEAKTGVKIHTPTREELVTRASSSMIVDLKRLEQVLKQKGPSGKSLVSAHAKDRIILSILQMPTEGLPVTLKTNEEKLAFALGQKLISSRFILMQDHISQEMAKQKEEEAKKASQTQEGEQNVGQQPQVP